MAKNKNLEQLLQVGAYGIGGYLFYKLGVREPNPLFGATVQKFLLEMKSAFSKTGNTAIGAGPGGGGAAPGGSTGQLGDLNSMMINNPNIGSQIAEWQLARRANGENPLDWNAFRAHAMRLFAPDPGPYPPAVFVNFR